MPSRLYVGNLAYSVSNDDLHDLFSQAGQVQSATVITDKFSGQSKGFGFVEMASSEEASKAIAQFNDSAVAPLRPAFRPGESPIAQSRWPCSAIWRSTGFDFNTELDWPAGSKKGARIYVASILRSVCRESAVPSAIFWYRPSDS